MCVSQHELQKEWREITDKGINRKVEVSAGPLSSSQISLSCVVFTLASCTHIHTHMHSITDVTRIQEGVAAYYILTAHTGCLAQLGLFKRLRLDKQRGLCSLLILSLPLSYQGVGLYVSKATTFFTHHANTHTQGLKLSLDCRIVTLLYPKYYREETTINPYLSFC